MDTFHALAEPTRRDIIEILAENGQLSASDIYDRFSVSPPAVSQHLKILREANLIMMEKRAQQRIYSINPHKISEVADWAQRMTGLWNERFERLDELLQQEKKKLKKNSN